MKTIAFFNNKGGVGKTTLVYHLAWMFADLGIRIVVVDLDPQSNLTSAFLTEERIAELWDEGLSSRSVLGAVQPLLDRLGDIQPPHVELVGSDIGLVLGDLGLNRFEDRLAQAWPACLDDNEANRNDAFRVMTAFWRVTESAASSHGADVALIDVGPNLGAINRAALVASDYVVVPLGADLFSLRGLQNLGPALREWRRGWHKRKQEPAPFALPTGYMTPVGYVVLQHVARADRPAKAYARWMERIRPTYTRYVLGQPDLPEASSHELAKPRHYHSLMPLAHDARKPIFKLTAADGAIGSHAVAAASSHQDFEALARRIAERCGIVLPEA
jgi:chromosome partitioning protein